MRELDIGSKSVHRWFFGILTGFAALALSYWVYFAIWCENSILQEVPSPSGRRKVVVFQRICGQQGVYGTHVSILMRNTILFDYRSGNAFIVENSPTDGNTATEKAPPVTANWGSEVEVTLRYPPSARIVKQVETLKRISLSYEPFGK